MGMTPRTIGAPHLAPLPILPQRRIQVINIVSRKGGAGKTTMALLSARYLACREAAPLTTLFDLDFSGTSLDDVIDPMRERRGEEGATGFEHFLTDGAGAPGWEAAAADALRRYELPGTSIGILYAASADKEGSSEEILLSGQRARDLARARLRRLVRWVVEQHPDRQDFMFLLDNSPGVRGLSRDLLEQMFEVEGSKAVAPPPEIQWVNVFVTTPDRQDLLATFAAWLGEWDRERGRLAEEGRSSGDAEREAASGLLFLVNKMRPEDGEIEKLLREMLPVGFKERGYPESEIRRLIEARILRVARCVEAADLALLFRGLRPVEVPPLDTYVPGLGQFLDSLLPAPRPTPLAVTPRSRGTRRRSLDQFFIRGGKEIDLEPVEEGIAIRAVSTARGLRSTLRAELERQGLDHTVGLEHPAVDVYKLPRGKTAKAIIDQLQGREGVRYVHRVYRHDPGRPDNVLVLTDRLFVQFQPDLSMAAIEKLTAGQGIHLVEPIEDMPGGFLALVKSRSPKSALEIANGLMKDQLAVFAEPDWVRALVHRGLPRSKLCEGDQWHLENTGQSKGTRGADAGVMRAWGLGAKGKGVTIAILDDGVDIDHPQLDRPGKLALGLDVRCRTPDPRPKYGDDHGTAAAGVALAARTSGKHLAPAGAAPAARLMAIRILPEVTAEGDFARAFRHARRHGADIVSCSWGPPDGRTVPEPIPAVVAHEIDLLITKGRRGLGAPIFFAAGNGEESVSTDGYASYQHVIAVAASDHHDQRAPYSNFGREIWVCAPSDPGGIVTLAPDAGHVDDFGGTSAACPLVAGVAALMLGANPKLTWAEIKEILAGTADKIDPAGSSFTDRFGHTRSTQYNSGGHSPAYGYGRVNADKAVQEAMRRKPRGKMP